MEIEGTIQPLTNVQRTQWNGFLGSLNGQPITEDAMNAHAEANPDFSIKPEMLPQIQQEHAAIRTGDSFSTLNSDQLNAARTGMSPGFMNQTDISKSFYPQFKVGSKDFGTDMEEYSKFKENVSNANTELPIIQKTGDGGPIPKPDYKNPASRLQYAKNIVKQYGPLMQGRGDTFLRINEIPEATDDDKLTARQISEKAAKPLGLDAPLLYASSMEEGMSGMYGSDKKLVDYSGNDKFPVDGFANFGLDNFSDFYPELVKKGYLSDDFKYKFSGIFKKNEKNERVYSANFKTVEDAMQAKAAVIRDSQDQTEEYAKKNGIKLSPKAKQFFTLINYNAGKGNMQKMIKEYNRNGYLNDDKFLEKRPSESWKAPYENVIRRIKMADIIKKEGLWEDNN